MNYIEVLKISLPAGRQANRADWTRLRRGFGSEVFDHEAQTESAQAQEIVSHSVLSLWLKCLANPQVLPCPE